MKSKEIVTFEIDRLPVSENNAVRKGKYGYYKTPKYKEWEEAVAILKDQSIVESKLYAVERVFHCPYNYKNGNFKKQDLTNWIKYSDDIFSAKLGIDDSRIKSGSEDQVDCEYGEEKTVWTIWPIG